MNVNGIDLTIIDSTGVYDYSWSEFAVMRGDDGYLYVGEDSGCSCYGFGDGLDEVTKVASWQDACAKAQEWAKEYASGEERQGCMDMIERLTVSRPAAYERAA
jgi:hypothetical protein